LLRSGHRRLHETKHNSPSERNSIRAELRPPLPRPPLQPSPPRPRRSPPSTRGAVPATAAPTEPVRIAGAAGNPRPHRRSQPPGARSRPPRPHSAEKGNGNPPVAPRRAAAATIGRRRPARDRLAGDRDGELGTHRRLAPGGGAGGGGGGGGAPLARPLRWRQCGGVCACARYREGEGDVREKRGCDFLRVTPVVVPLFRK